MNLTESGKRPNVSILIAARNEEHTILHCLQSIENLTFPKTHLEVWVGDDDSTDRTYAVVDEFIRNKPYFHLIRITETLGHARAKANVLAHLTRQATSSYFFMTDADIVLPPGWIETMLDACQLDVGVVTGITAPKATNVWAALQALEWIYAIRIIWQLSLKNIPITSIGNNMLVTRQAYEATGGYEQIPFSITEDFALFRAVIQNGYGFRQLYTPEVLASTEPMTDGIHWLRQRKRWMHGAMSLPLHIRLVLIAQFFFSLFLVGLFFVQPVIAAILFLALGLWQLIALWRGLSILKLPQLRKYTGIFIFYFHFFVLISMIYYLLPTATHWKGRTY